jgi:hypothetical protein
MKRISKKVSTRLNAAAAGRRDGQQSRETGVYDPKGNVFSGAVGVRAYWASFDSAYAASITTTTAAATETFVASGDEMQQAFASLQDAMAAAQNAPWADGRVFRHDCRPEDFSGFGELGGEQVL